MKKNQSYSSDVTTTPPSKVMKTSILSRFANSTQVSPSSGKGSQPVFINIVKEEGEIVGLAIDGAYDAGQFLTTPNVKQDLMDLEAPYEDVGTVKSLPIKGKLFKANSDETRQIISKDGSVPSLDLFNKICPYVVSQVGESPGSCKVWVFTALQLIELQKINKSVEVEGTFEEVVYERIRIFFEKTKKPLLVKDVNTLKSVRFQPTTFDEAMQTFGNRSNWVIKTRTFDLDTEEKAEAFACLAYNI